MLNLSASIESSVRRLFPDMSTEQAILSLLLERAQKNLIKYQAIARAYQDKYKTDFENFRAEVITGEPPCEVEQDYFDWELAVTGIFDMESEIDRLRREAQTK